MPIALTFLGLVYIYVNEYAPIYLKKYKLNT